MFNLNVFYKRYSDFMLDHISESLCQTTPKIRAKFRIDIMLTNLVQVEQIEILSAKPAENVASLGVNNVGTLSLKPSELNSTRWRSPLHRSDATLSQRD